MVYLDIPMNKWADKDEGETIYLWCPTTNEFRIFHSTLYATACARNRGREHGNCWYFNVRNSIYGYVWFTYIGIDREVHTDKVPKEFKTLIMLAKD